MDYNAADLTSVLRTLSALSNPQPSQPQPPPPPPQPQPPKQQPHTPQTLESEEDDSYEPSETLPHIPTATPPHPQPPAPVPTIPTGPQPGAPPNGKPTEDPSTITAWPGALRYVMRTVAQNEDIQRRIRWLIQRQHDHEKQWWQGREALLRKQQARTEKKKELDAVL
ncbi:hypothetical protein BO70DRAFT_365853 [Aspergillus heteromorphus CBS 117.55]|uniref:Uncharacterized protein n=1 Tax=Aspergillus heteromorphus CBS 117.55 TaxID=1448321 RepID=A0A317V871_9EURO|nr:uncharacterized protein BO70DRAFT_365853 [Aspergillus heteromorphus CBS 117.55]PWY69579.1 hypothetical protein BO70DRAFT_365853 [Aspergillus heteromorphus CBS 117.55]